MKKDKGLYLEIIKEPEYIKLMLSTVINRFGDSVDAIAFTWLVYQITQSAFWSVIVFALNMLPNVIVQPFAGAIVEKMNKKAVVVFTHVLRALIIALFVFFYIKDYVNPALMAAFTLLVTTVESFNLPATTAFTSEIVKKEHITAGMSLSKMLSSAATLAGTGAAGFIIAKLGVHGAMLIDVFTFIIAALFIGIMKTNKNNIKELAKPGSEEEDKTDKKYKKSKLAFFLDGLKYVAKSPVIRNFGLIAVALNFLLIPINALEAPIANEIFNKGEEILSFAGAFAAIGGIAGSFAIPFLSKKLSPLKEMCLGISGLGIGILGIALGGLFRDSNVASYVDVSLSYFIMMFSASLIGSIIGIQFMKCADPKYIARASAVMGAAGSASMPIGSVLLSLIVSHVSSKSILVFCAVFALIVLGIMVIVKPRLELESHEEEKKELADAV